MKASSKVGGAFEIKTGRKKTESGLRKNKKNLLLSVHLQLHQTFKAWQDPGLIKFLKLSLLLLSTYFDVLH